MDSGNNPRSVPSGWALYPKPFSNQTQTSPVIFFSLGALKPRTRDSETGTLPLSHRNGGPGGGSQATLAELVPGAPVSSLFEFMLLNSLSFYQSSAVSVLSPCVWMLATIPSACHWKPQAAGSQLKPGAGLQATSTHFNLNTPFPLSPEGLRHCPSSSSAWVSTFLVLFSAAAPTLHSVRAPTCSEFCLPQAS